MKSRAVKVHRFDPEEPSNTYVAHLLPFGSVEGNTRERLQLVAQTSGYTILAAHAPGTGKPYVSGGKSLPSLFRRDIHAVARRFYAPFMDAVQAEAGPNKRIIAAADSGRVAITAALALHERDLVAKGEIEKPVIQAVLGRDGALLNSMPIPKAAAHLLRNGSKRTGSEEAMAPPSARTQLYAAACSVAEMMSHARLMSSTTPRETIEQLAAADVPFCYVSLTEGLAGPEEDCRAFNTKLERLRDDADVRAELITDLRAGGHGDLMSYTMLAEDLIRTATALAPA